MSLSVEKTALKNALETYGKQIDLEITRGAKAKASGEVIHITDVYARDNSLTVTVKRRNLLDISQASATQYCSYNGGNTITSEVTDNYYGFIRMTYLNSELMDNRGRPITFSAKSAPTGTVFAILISGTRQNGATYQEFNSNPGVPLVTGIIAEDFTKINYIELRFNRKAVKHTSTYTFENFQLEFSDTATEYTPYIEDLSAVNVTRRSRNLFDVSKHTSNLFYAGDGVFVNPNAANATVTNREYVGIDITDIWNIANNLGQKITISFDLKVAKAGSLTVYALGKKKITQKPIAGTTEWQSFNYTAALATDEKDVNGNVCTLSFYGVYGSGVIPYVRNIQIELGEEATPLEEYDGATATADEAGVVKTLTTTPVTTITSDTAGVILEAEYKAECAYTSTDIVSCTPSHEGSLLTAIMKEAEIELDGAGGPELAEEIKGDKLFVALTVTAGETAKKEFGTLIVKEAEYKDETNSIVLTCYDLMLRAMTPYSSRIDFTPAEGSTTSPVTLGSYLQAICDHLQIPLATPTFTNSDVIIDEEKYDNSYTVRDVLTEIAQAAAGTIAIKNDELYVLYPTASGVTIEPSNLKSIKIGELYGPVNSVVIARTPQEDNIYRKDEAAETICEIKIENNQLMDSHREDFIEGIYNALYGLTYYPHEVESYGIGILDICDLFTIETLDGKNYTALHLAGSMEINQGLTETTKGTAPAATETEYKAASKTDRTLNKTILRVDKQLGVIEGEVTKVVNETNRLTGTLENIEKSVKATMTEEDIKILVSTSVEGKDSITTSMGYTFNDAGLYIKKSGEEIENQVDHTGVYVNRGNDNVLTANHEGVKGINLTAKQYLIVGKNSRFEDYEETRGALFYIGG